MIESLETYIENIDDIVRKSVLEIQNVEIDEYNDCGCNGYVFFGNHKIFRKRVAIKFYYYGEDSHEEVALLKNIKKENLLNVWDAMQVEGGWAYFITDEISQGNLDDYKNSNILSVKEVIKIIRGILTGVSTLHESDNQLLHRDLKLANILIDNKGNPTIADFGSIKRIAYGNDSVSPSKNSLLYKAPEAISSNIYNYQSDIYQVGIMLYQLVGGYLPYNYEEYLNIKQIKELSKIDDACDKSMYIDKVIHEKIVRGKLCNMSSIPVHIEERIIKIIRKAIHVDLNKRYKNTSEFFLDLHKLGNMADWVRIDQDTYECEYKSIFYRVVIKKGKFILEQSKDYLNWRKDSKINLESNLKCIFSDIHKYLSSK